MARRRWFGRARRLPALVAVVVLGMAVAAVPAAAEEPVAGALAAEEGATAPDEASAPDGAGVGEPSTSVEVASACVIGASAKDPISYVNGGQRYYQARGSFWNTCRTITAIGEVALQRWTGSVWSYLARSPQFVIPNGTACCWYERWATGSYCAGDSDLYRTRSTFNYANTSRTVIGNSVELPC